MLTRYSCPFLLITLMGGCFQQDNAKTSQILPQDYKSSYVLARSCRYSTSHTRFIKVLTNNRETNEAYLAGNCLLALNSLVLAEEYDKADCASVTGYTLMYKESGYDPDHNDWRWQKMDDQRSLLEDGHVQSCIDCHQQCSQAATPEYTCSR
jgi:hypothetical protein